MTFRNISKHLFVCKQGVICPAQDYLLMATKDKYLRNYLIPQPLKNQSRLEIINKFDLIRSICILETSVQ